MIPQFCQLWLFLYFVYSVAITVLVLRSRPVHRTTCSIIALLQMVALGVQFLHIGYLSLLSAPSLLGMTVLHAFTLGLLWVDMSSAAEIDLSITELQAARFELKTA